MSPLILAARGSRHPHATPAIQALAARVAAAHPGRRVRAAFLDVEVPSLAAALAKEAGLAHDEAIVVPLLLTTGRHARIVLPNTVQGAVTARLGMAVRVADGLGPLRGREPDQIAGELLALALQRRLSEVLPGHRPDAIVVAAAGSRSTRAMQTAQEVARWLAARTGIGCQTAFSTVGTPVGAAVSALRRRGAASVAVAPYLLAPGLLYDRVLAEASQAGASAVAAPLCDAPEIVQLITARAAAFGLGAAS